MSFQEVYTDYYYAMPQNDFVLNSPRPTHTTEAQSPRNALFSLLNSYWQKSMYSWMVSFDLIYNIKEVDATFLT